MINLSADGDREGEREERVIKKKGERKRIKIEWGGGEKIGRAHV